MLLLVAVDHSRLVDGIVAIRDSTEQKFGSHEFEARSSFRRKYKHKTPITQEYMAFLSDCWSLVGWRLYIE